MPEGDDISIELQYGFEDTQRQRWLVMRLAVGPDIVWDMLPNPATPRSSISRSAFDDLTTRGSVATGSRRRILLQDLRIDGQSIPNVEVSVSTAVGRLGVDGMLGLDFFEQFTAIHWYPRTRQVILSYS